MFFGRNTSGRGKSKLLLVASIAGQIFAAGSADAQTKGARFLPIQSISYRLGTGVAQGYFVQGGGSCQLVLMIGEAGDNGPGPFAVTRIRVALAPDQAGTFDSPGSPSLVVRCAHDAGSVIVSREASEQMVAQH
jgi:hypothetical protein